MKTEIFKENEIEKAVEILKAGGLVAFPTETVYGLACICDKETSFERLVQVKNRRPDQPFTLMCSSIDQALNYCLPDEGTKRVMDQFMPGAITILVKPKDDLSPWMTLNSPFIGIRIPGSKLVLDLIDKVGTPLLVPSANKTGEKTSTDFEEVLKVFDGEIDGIIEGKCNQLIASTIVKFDNGEVSLVRKGLLEFDKIKSVYLGGNV